MVRSGSVAREGESAMTVGKADKVRVDDRVTSNSAKGERGKGGKNGMKAKGLSDRK